MPLINSTEYRGGSLRPGGGAFSGLAPVPNMFSCCFAASCRIAVSSVTLKPKAADGGEGSVCKSLDLTLGPT